MKSFFTPILFVFALLVSMPSFAGDIGYVGEEGTEIEVFRVSSPAAEYPRRAIRLGIEGSVKLEFDVDTDGSVLDPYVNGTSVKVNNVQISLTFKLAN